MRATVSHEIPHFECFGDFEEIALIIYSQNGSSVLTGYSNEYVAQRLIHCSSWKLNQTDIKTCQKFQFMEIFYGSNGSSVPPNFELSLIGNFEVKNET